MRQGVTRQYLKRKWPRDHRMQELIDYIHQLMPIVIWPDGIVSGGLVTWITGLTFSVSATSYWLQNVFHEILGAEVTLDPADATYSRRDVIAVNDQREVVVLKGTPSANPQKPTVDRLTMIELTDVLVPAGATEPGGITNDLIYDENAEWTPLASGVTVNFDAVTDPFSGLKCADVGAIGTGDKITFTSAQTLTVADFETLSLFLKLKSEMLSNHYLRVRFLLGGVSVSETYTLQVAKVNTDWQNIGVSLSAVTFSGTGFDAVQFEWLKTGTITDHAGFYLDVVKLEKGIQQTPSYENIYVTALDFDSGSRVLTLKQNGLPDLEVELPLLRGQNYFLHNDASDIATYESLRKNTADHTEEIASVAIVSGDGETLIQEFATAVGEPGTNQIEHGVWEFDFYHYVSSSNTGDTSFVYRLFKRSSAGVETELFNLETAVITAETVALIKTYYAATADIDLLISDRLVLKVYAKTTSASAVTASLVYEGDTSASHLQTPIAISSTSTVVGGGISEIPFEFCIISGVAETFDLDIYVTSGYTISKAILKSDGILTGVQIKIGATAITGLDAMDVGAVAVFTATANNVAAEGDSITLVTSGTDTGAPTYIKGKIVLA